MTPHEHPTRHRCVEPQGSAAGGAQDTPTTNGPTEPRQVPLSGADHPGSHQSPASQKAPASGVQDTATTSEPPNSNDAASSRVDHPTGQAGLDPHGHPAGRGKTPDLTTQEAAPNGVPSGRADRPAVAATRAPDPKAGAPLLLDSTIRTIRAAAEVFTDIEKAKIGARNRIDTLVRKGPDKDGVQRGSGLDADHPSVKALLLVHGALAKTHHEAALALKRALRQHPLAEYAKRPEMKGVGEQQLARLLAAIGDPYWNTLHGRPRTVSELWSYCGLRQVPSDDTGALVAVRRRQKVKSNWSNEGKMRARMIAESCIKAQGRYADVYYSRRAVTEGKVHDSQCMNRSRISPNGCGIQAHPEWGAAGSPWRPGHQHADALRVVAREVLRDLWTAAKEIHETSPGGHETLDPHGSDAAGAEGSEGTP